MSLDLHQRKKFFDFTNDQKLSWLRLYRSQNVGPSSFRDLISHFGTAALALENLPELAKRGGAASKIKIATENDIIREMEAARHLNASFICLGENDYPPLLRQLEQAPPVLCVKGNTEIFHSSAVAIVGSRNASISGLKLTERFSKQLGEKGRIIVSGLARGIDTAAHKAALQTGTIAVFAGGLDCIYPEENQQLAFDIVENGGALVTEMPMGWKPRAQDFPRRNRIVTGLSAGVLVIEAAKRSGSLITARLANEAGRVVLAVPGSPLDPRSDGTNGLIREGATLVTSTEDIEEALSPLSAVQSQFVFDVSEGEDQTALGIDENNHDLEEPTQSSRERVISSLSTTPVEVDDIVHYAQTSPGEVQFILLELDLAGRLQRHSGNRVSLI